MRCTAKLDEVMTAARMAKKKAGRKAVSSSLSSNGVQSTQDNELEVSWEITEIIEEQGNHYLVRWAGIDPETKKPWSPSWVDKTDCNAPILVQQWQKAKQNAAKPLSHSGSSRRKQQQPGTLFY